MNRTIHVGGRDYPVAFTMSALMNFTRKEGITLGGLFKLLGYGAQLEGQTAEEVGASLLFNAQISLDQIVEATRFALKAGANAEGKPKDYTTEEVANLFDQKDGLVLEILELLILSITKLYSPPGEEQEGDAGQKKAKPKAAKAAKN
jgi:hypothetical protein